MALAPPAEGTAEAEARVERKKQGRQILSLVEESANNCFTNMHKAFQSLDMDRSGRLSRQEIARALDLWNIPFDQKKLDVLFALIDGDGDGVSYEEFVDHLARGTVAPAAMGKRGLQSKEAMGVDSQEMLAKQLGHKTDAERKAFVPSINAATTEPNARILELMGQIRHAVEQRYRSPAEAFCKIRKAKPHKITAEELHQAMGEWRVLASTMEAAKLVEICDTNHSGLMDYAEFAKSIMSTAKA